MKKVHIIDFINFLRRANALDKFINAVREQNVESLLDFGLTHTQAWSWLNCIIWGATDEGQTYWQNLEKEWQEELGFDPVAELEKILL